MSSHATNLKEAAKVEGKLAKFAAKEVAGIAKIAENAIAANSKNKKKFDTARAELLASLDPSVTALLSKASDGE